MSDQVSTLRAKCALAGIVMHVSEDDRGQLLYIVSKWALTKAFSDLSELEAWICRVTGQAQRNHA